MKHKETFDKAVHDLQTQLQQLDSQHLLINRISDQHVHVKFIGNFQGQLLVWNAFVRTMRDYYEYELKQSADEKIALRPFIKIEKEDSSYKISLVLNLDKIDEAAIKKSIIMVRKYKRLSVGRHEYGDVCYFENK